MDPQLLNSTAPDHAVIRIKGISAVKDGINRRGGISTDRKVSHAAIKTLSPFWISQKQTLDRLVDFPTPFTPTKVMLYGSLCWEEGRGDDSLVRMERRRSVEVLGVSIRVKLLESARRTAAFVAETREGQPTGHEWVPDEDKPRTLESSNLLTHETFTYTFTDLICNFFRHILLH